MKKFSSYSISLLVLFLIVFSFASCSTQEEQIPKNIILLIGDGMGYTHVTAGQYEFGELNMTEMPFSGSILTHSKDSRVTDSASSATALSTGFKTNNGMLALLPDGTELQTIAQYASELGKSTALLASCRITHATPAAFGVHHESRSDEFIIAEKFVDSGIDMLLGAGYQYFLPENLGGQRPDNRDLIAEMTQMGYMYIDDESELDQIAGQERVIAFLEPNNLQRYPARGDQMNQLTKAALEQLSQNPDGFFMMIEGAMIDWGGHANDLDYMLQELKDFDNIIGDVLEFAENDSNTLVIVTADHETGGLTLPIGSDEIDHTWSTGSHTAAKVPVFSYGPSAELFTGTYDNTEIARLMFELWGSTFID